MFQEFNASDPSESIDELVSRLLSDRYRGLLLLEDAEFDALEQGASGEERRDETSVGDGDVGWSDTTKERPIQMNDGREEHQEGPQLAMQILGVAEGEGGVGEFPNDEMSDPLSSSGMGLDGCEEGDGILD